MSHEPKSLEERKVEALEDIAKHLKALADELGFDAYGHGVPHSLRKIDEALREVLNISSKLPREA